MDERNLAQVQEVLNHAPYYHTTIVQHSASGLAERCFEAPAPEVENSRVFKRFFIVDAPTIAKFPVATVDLYAGFPNYKTASIAMLVVREDCQRKGIGSTLLTRVLPAFLAECHPAVEFLSVSMTENNVPALRCLVKNQFERTNRWEKLDINDKPVIALTYRLRLKK